MNIKFIVEAGEDGYFVAHVPSLKSCWSQGKTKEEAFQNIREAIDLYLEPEPKELATASAPKARNVIAWANGPGGQTAHSPSSEGAK
jgi:predicted RNase H-like HicB family nuclease